MPASSALTRLTAATAALRPRALRFWQWWSGELLALLPPSLVQRLGQRGPLLFVEWQDGQCRLRRELRGSSEVLASAPASPDEGLPGLLHEPLRRQAAVAGRVILRLPADSGLRRELGLPAAAEGNLGNVLRFEMDRHTPFSGEQVHFGCRVRGRDSVRQRLQVELQVVPRERLDPLLAQLAALGVHAERLLLGDGEMNALGWIDLRPPAGSGLRGGWRRNPWLQGAALALGLLALVLLPLQLRERSLAALEDSLTEPRRLAGQAAQVQAELQRLQEARALLEAQRQRAPQALLLLAELTGRLPDHTWLTRFELARDRVRLEGESAEASSLLGLLEDSRYLSNVSFASPITSNPRTRRERFSLQAERRAAPDAAP